MTLPLMLCSLLIGGALTIAALVLHAQERAASRPVRWIWAAMMAATLALTAVAATRQEPTPQVKRVSTTLLDDASLRALPHTEPTGIDALVSWSRAVLAVPSARLTAATASTSRLLARAPAPAHRAVAVLWGVSSLLCMAMLLLVYRRARRAAHAWHTARLLGTDVRVSEDAGPAVVGLRPMQIVVPAWILGRPADDQRLVLQHEQEHIRAGDPLLLVSACIAVALMPWNPFLWVALSRLRLAVEIDCDRRVLRRGTATSRYARLLLDLSGHPSQRASSLPALAYSASHLERRLLAMTARPARYLLPRRLAGGAVAGLLVLAACESRMPTSAEVESMDARKAVATASALPGIDSTRTEFMVDGQQVSKRVAEGVAANRIASIEVVKGKARTSQIRLRTLTGALDTTALQPSRIRLADTGAIGTGDTVRYSPSQTTVPLMRTRADSTSPTGVETQGGTGSRIRVRGMASIPLQGSKRSFDGLFIIDGRLVSDTALSTMDPNRIASIEVIKGAAAAALYSDPRAVHGVIVITTKKP